jgi:hypothetical protein
MKMATNTKDEESKNKGNVDASQPVSKSLKQTNDTPDPIPAVEIGKGIASAMKMATNTKDEESKNKGNVDAS